jgi:arylsulfatase A-like enzyme
MRPAHEKPLDDLVTEMLERPLSRRELLRRGRNLGLTVAASSFLAACGTAAATQPPAASSRPKHLVMVIIDAGRADYISKHIDELPNIRTLIRTGTQYDRAWVGQLEAITPASHASIGSGCFPSHNGGILGFWWEDPNTQTTYNSVPLNGTDPDALSVIMANAGTPTIAEFIKRHDSRAKVYTASGQKFYAADAVGGVHADFVSYYHEANGNWTPRCMPGRELPSGLTRDASVTQPMTDVADQNLTNLGKQDALVGDLALNVVRKERPRVVILNLPEMDWPVAHAWGGPRAPQAVIRLLHTADDILGTLMGEYRAEGIFDDTVWLVMGDHGVTPIEQSVDRYTLQTAIEDKLGATQVVTSDSHTSCFFWVYQPGQALAGATAVEASADAMVNVSGVYYLATQGAKQVYLPAPTTARTTHPSLLRAHQYLMSTMIGPNAPHIICVFPERTGTFGAGATDGSAAWLGDHGGPSWGSQAIPLIMSGPGVRRGHISHYPARLVDVAPTAMRLLGAYYPPTDGIVLADAMINASPADTARQKTVAGYLVPHAEAIRRHSSEETANMAPVEYVKIAALPPPPSTAVY